MKKLKRDPAIELARLLGCLIVIGVHTALGYQVNDGIDKGRLFLAMIFADGVAIFWLIQGCFFFSGASYGKILKKTFGSIVVPMLCISFLQFYFNGYLEQGVSIKESITHSFDDYKNIGKCLLEWKNFAPSSGHLWYLYCYILIAVIYPALQAFVRYLDEDRKRQQIYILVMLLILMINDLSGNAFGNFSHHTFGAVVPAAMEVILGHILYQNRDILCRKRILVWILPVSFILLNGMREFLQLHEFDLNHQDKVLMYWYSVWGAAAACCIVIWCMNMIKGKDGTLVNRLICWLASFTFPIYLIHICVRNVYNRLGLQNRLQKAILRGTSSFGREIAYSATIVLLVFGTSLLIIFVFRFLNRICKKAIH